MQAIAQLSGVSKRFGQTLAVDDLSFSVGPGEALALLGPNGAGKSTTLDILTGLRRPDTGSATLFGMPSGTAAGYRRFGATPQATDFPPQLTPRELIRFTAAHFSRPHSLDRLIADFGLERLIDRQVAGFSGGERRRVALALAFAGNPELVFLDEPTAGLDSKFRAGFWQHLNEFVAAGGSVVIASHDWQEIGRVTSRIVMIDRGQLVIDGTIADIRTAVGLKQVAVKLPPESAVTPEATVDGEARWITAGADALVRDLVSREPDFADLRIEPLPLEDALAIYRNANDGH